MSERKSVTIHTDGACINNPGPGGYAAVLLCEGRRKELSGGRRLTTSNRMEMLAAVTALQTLKVPCAVTVYTDSRYLADGIRQGWAQRWRANDWMLSRTKKARNRDLWEALLQACARHQVLFEWIRGHAGNPENERSDRLSVQAARANDLPPDEGYEHEPEDSAAQGTLFPEEVFS
jgi:ribonuclease HI